MELPPRGMEPSLYLPLHPAVGQLEKAASSNKANIYLALSM